MPKNTNVWHVEFLAEGMKNLTDGSVNRCSDFLSFLPTHVGSITSGDFHVHLEIYDWKIFHRTILRHNFRHTYSWVQKKDETKQKVKNKTKRNFRFSQTVFVSRKMNCYKVNWFQYLLRLFCIKKWFNCYKVNSYWNSLKWCFYKRKKNSQLKNGPDKSFSCLLFAEPYNFRQFFNFSRDYAI